VLGRHTIPACTARGRIAACVSRRRPTARQRAHDRCLAALGGEQLPEADALDVTHRLEHDHASAQAVGLLRGATQGLHRVEHPVLLGAWDGHRVVRRPSVLGRATAGGDDDRVGFERQHRRRCRPHPGAQLDTSPLALGDTPVGEMGDLAPPRQTLGPADRTAELGGRLEQRHPMAARRRHPGRLETGGPAADDHDPLRACRGMQRAEAQLILAAHHGFWTQLIGMDWSRLP